jgi:hypothetical protein
MESSDDPTSPQAEVPFIEEDQTIEDALMLQKIELKQSVPNLTELGEGTTSVSEKTTSSSEAAPVPSGPTPQHNTVSGLYVGRGGRFELHLRIDVDGHSPLRKVSGDFYRLSGNTTTYSGSFIVDTITITATTALITIEGI